MTFDDLGLAEPLLRALHAEGYTTPTPIQGQAIPHVIAGRDLIGVAQTGTGKTAAFALPTLHRLANTQPRGKGRRPIRALILSPTRELAAQIAESLRTYGRNLPIRQAVIYGGVSQFHQTRALRGGVDMLVATPGRLLDLMNQGYIDLRNIETFVLDEADRMLDMGFMPDIRRVVSALPKQRQTLLFSATMPEAIRELTESVLHDPVSVSVAPKQETTNLVEQSVVLVPQSQKSGLLADMLTQPGVTRAIVFTRTKHGADRVALQLGRQGITAESIHGNKSQGARQRTLASFKSSRPPVLVATDLAARGLDVDGVSHVFNFDLPTEPETYVHRIGRTGRAGAAGIAVSFCDPGERKHLLAIERLTRKSIRVEANLAGDLPPLDDGRPRRGRSGGRPRRPGGPGGYQSGGYQSGGPRPGGSRPGRRPKRSRPAQAQ